MPEPMEVEVVAADRIVWQGKAVNVIARTTEGDIGILPGHEPLLAALVPCVADVVTADGNRESIALDGGFISVNQNRVALLSQYAADVSEIDLAHAERELDELSQIIDSGDATEKDVHRFNLATAQVAAAKRAQH